MTDSQERPAFDKGQVELFISTAAENRANKKNETVVREVLVAHLAKIFGQPWPWWVTHHMHGAEHHLKYLKEGQEAQGFGDSVVGATAIEYESDLTSIPKFNEGQTQVKQYCAGLLNQGVAAETVRGILSDTVEWYAYEIGAVTPKATGAYDQDDVQLAEVEKLVCDPGDPKRADRLVDFWLRHLAREGTRPLTARSIAEYLAPTSVIAQPGVEALARAVSELIADDSAAAGLVSELWKEFVSYLSEHAPSGFDQETYVAEFYVAVLARLICANVIEKRALRSNDDELDRIINGQFFIDRGINRLVEYDYFGWLTAPQHIDRIRPCAAALQADLAAFDFGSAASEDLFGEMVSQFAGRKQRLLLGQEWTPRWLAAQIAECLFQRLGDQDPRFVDMCCGSGAMLVEVTQQARARAEAKGLKGKSQEALDYLQEAVTGFDIDPLAVTLAKANWVVANRDWLEPFEGKNQVAVPVYHVDSLFALAPVFASDLGMSSDAAATHTLKLDDLEVDLPAALITPELQRFFDALIERVYRVGTSDVALNGDLAKQIVADAGAEAAPTLDQDTKEAGATFALGLAEALRDLNSRGRNGVWAFVIRNSYRPSLVGGQFNGLISNPPWLAMSRIANNPFSEAVKNRADQYGLTPTGAAFLHVDMSTTFLADAVSRYLSENAVVGCVLPGTVRRGANHKPFREQVGRHNDTEAKFDLDVDEVWQVERGTFKNLAVVVFGTKQKPKTKTEIVGFEIGPKPPPTPANLHVNALGDRVIWGDIAGWTQPGGYPESYFQQGADLMPRTCVFVDTRPAGNGRVTVSAPGKGSDTYYLVGDAKKAKGLTPGTKTVPARLVTHAWISKHLAPFDLAAASPALIPVERDTQTNGWREMPHGTIVAEATVKGHFDETTKAAGEETSSSYFESLNTRSKLTRQQIGTEGWLVVYGAGGKIPAAAHTPLDRFATDPVMIDQTLYWGITDTETEALYIVGILNSAALHARVAEYAPEGLFNERHLHTLPAKFVPKFDPADPKHVALAAATQSLIGELEAARASDPELKELFDPSRPLSGRRSGIRKAIEGLPSFGAYDAAADDVYG